MWWSDLTRQCSSHTLIVITHQSPQRGIHGGTNSRQGHVLCVRVQTARESRSRLNSYPRSTRRNITCAWCVNNNQSAPWWNPTLPCQLRKQTLRVWLQTSSLSLLSSSNTGWSPRATNSAQAPWLFSSLKRWICQSMLECPHCTAHERN